MNTPKKRGRPKSEATIENERIDEILRNAAVRTKTTAENLEDFEWIHDYLEKLYSEFSPTIPRELIRNYASLHDESMEGYQDQILHQWAKAHESLVDGQIKGANSISKQSRQRAQAVWGKNSDLVRRITNKNLSVTGASTKIITEWDKRGDGQKIPSIRTLFNWYKFK